MLRQWKQQAEEIAFRKFLELSDRKQRDGRADTKEVSKRERQQIIRETVRELKDSRKECKFIPAWIILGILQGFISYLIRKWLDSRNKDAIL